MALHSIETEKEAELFVKKYYEVVGKEITDEVIKKELPEPYKWSNDKEDIALFACILESVGIEIKAEYICYECGLAYAIVKKDKEIIKEVQKHKDKLSDSASLVLDYLITGETEKELFVKDERDEVFKRLLEGLKK
ncbi:MAG: hypothetical protein ACE5KE_13600 [Methanosarcinales archaeon]